MVMKSRIDTPIEVDYYMHGGIMPTSAGVAAGRLTGTRRAMR